MRVASTIARAHARETSTGSSSFSELPVGTGFHKASAGSSTTSEPSSVQPLPVAMLAFGMSNFLLGCYSIRGTPVDALMIAQGVAFGGVVQFSAGIVAFAQRSALVGYLCTIFGAWWMCIMASETILPSLQRDAGSLVAYTAVWLIFTFQAMVVLMRNWRTNIVGPAAMVCVNITSLQLILLPWFSRRWLEVSAGSTTALSGVLGFYIGAALFINSVFERPVLPLGPADIASNRAQKLQPQNRTSINSASADPDSA